MRASAWLPLVLAVVPALGLAGCTMDEPMRSTGETPRGHPVAASTLHAAGVALSGLALARESGDASWEIGEADPMTDHRALILYGARLAPGGEGTLVVLPEDEALRTTGPVRYVVSALSMRAGTQHERVARNATPNLLPPDDALRAAGFHADAFFGEPIELRASATFTLRASRIVLVDAAGARELGAEARVEAFDAASATGPFARLAPAADARLAVADARGALALADGVGVLEITDDAGPVALDGASIVTLAEGSVVRVAPASETVAVHVEGRAFQAIVEGAPQLRARIAVRVMQSEIEIGEGETRAVDFEFVSLDRDTDAILADVRIEGAPDGAVALPRFTPLIEEITREFEDEPLALLMIAPAMPGIALLSFVESVAAMFDGVSDVPQRVPAAMAFHSKLVVRRGVEPFEARLVVEGNFESASAVLVVR